MNQLNSILLEGNLVKDPEMKQTPKGTAICEFSIASNRFFKTDAEIEKEVSFFEVEVWAGLAEKCGSVLKKGRGVRVVGRLKQDRWIDEGGQNRQRIKVIGEHVEFKPSLKEEIAAAAEGDVPEEREELTV